MKAILLLFLLLPAAAEPEMRISTSPRVVGEEATVTLWVTDGEGSALTNLDVSWSVQHRVEGTVNVMMQDVHAGERMARVGDHFEGRFTPTESATYLITINVRDASSAVENRTRVFSVLIGNPQAPAEPMPFGLPLAPIGLAALAQNRWASTNRAGPAGRK